MRYRWSRRVSNGSENQGEGSAAIEIRFLGSFEAVTSDGASVECAPRQKAILAYLAIRANESVNAERILHDVWGPDPPSSGLGTLRFHISKLRGALSEADSDAIETTTAGYRLNIDVDSIDAVRFEKLSRAASAALAHDPRDARRLCRRALALWRGAALLEFRYDEFAQEATRQLEEQRLTTLETRLEAELSMGMHRDIIPELEILASEHPTRERLHGSLMTALYRAERTAEALRIYADISRTLGERGIEPGESLKELEEQILLGNPDLLASASRPVQRQIQLPAPASSIIGRDVELADVLQELRDGRFVTLIGPGGVGKTRLANEVSHAMASEGHGGAFWVDLAAKDVDSTRSALLSAVAPAEEGAPSGWDRAIETLSAFDDVLVVLDNCEHVREPTAEIVDDLLAEVPNVRILATSRTPIDVAAERIVRVIPLACPDETDLEHLLENESVRLFTERANVARSIDTTDHEWVSEAARICQLVSGLPLALEIAAARTRVLAISDLRVALETSGLSVLTRAEGGDARQRSVRYTIEWSYNVLGEAARRVFEMCSVFRGGFSAPAAERLIDSGDISNELADLVDSSLLIAEGALVTRFRYLEPVRRFADEKLSETGTHDLASSLHASYFAERVEEYRLALVGEGWGTKVREDPDLANIHQSIDWFVAHDRWSEAARVIDAMADSWMTGHLHGEARYWLERFCREAAEAPTLETAHLLDDATYLAVLQGELAEARSSEQRMARLVEAIQDPTLSARGAMRSASVLWFDGRRMEALQRLERAFDVLRERDPDGALKAGLLLGKGYVTVGRFEDALETADSLPDWVPTDRVVASAFGNEIRSRARYFQGRLVEAEEQARLAVRALEDAHLDHNAASALVVHARPLIDLGEHGQANELVHRAMDINFELGDLLNATRCMREGARSAVKSGMPSRAAEELIRAVETIDLAAYPLEFARFALVAAQTLFASGRHEGAARTSSWALARLDELGTPVPAPLQEDLGAMDDDRSAASESDWAQWTTEGYADVNRAPARIVDSIRLAID